MMMIRRPTALFLVLSVLAAGLVLTGCDSALPPDSDPTLVVEGFIGTGEPAPSIRLSRTMSLTRGYDSVAAAVTEADVSVIVGGRNVRYGPEPGRPGLFRPVDGADLTARPGDVFALDIDWNGRRASAGGTVPPPIRLLSLDVVVPDEPVSAVLLDSLLLSDSLAVGAYKGYIYPIEVSLTWEAAADPGGEFWVRAQLRPYADFSSTVVDLFLRSEAIFQESGAAVGSPGSRRWTGVYAVGVEGVDDPVPDHTLRVAILRSGRDYARFASSRHAPERREPTSNLEGAIGIFTAVSVDSTRVQVGAAR